MNTTPDLEPDRDFSGWALLRGWLASALCAYVVIMILSPTLLFSRNLFDLSSLLERLSQTVQLANFLVGMVFTSAFASVALALLFRTRRDHSTFLAASMAGAKAAGLGIGSVYLIGLVLNLFAVRPPGYEILAPANWKTAAGMLWLAIIVVGAGAVSGLAFRAAAGAPTVERAPDAA